MPTDPRVSSPIFHNRTSRRRLIGGALAGMTASAALVGTAGAQDATPSSSPANGEWTFTDDKDVTVTLPSRPQRILADVNAAAPLWDFGIRPVAVFGWNATESGGFGAAGGNIDPKAVTIVGDGNEPIKVEAAAAQKPDVIITITWEPENPSDYWSIVDEDVLAQVKPIAPLIAISATGMADANTERFAELAGALGADLSSPELVEAKSTYEAALASFKTDAAAKSELTVLFLSIDEADAIYVASPPDWADLSLYENLGLTLVHPDAKKYAYWEELSAEQALKYPADVIFNSARPGTLTAEQLQAHPTWGLHPAVKAGQIGSWNQDFIMSYQGMAAALEATISPVRTAEKVT